MAIISLALATPSPAIHALALTVLAVLVVFIAAGFAAAGIFWSRRHGL